MLEDKTLDLHRVHAIRLIGLNKVAHVMLLHVWCSLLGCNRDNHLISVPQLYKYTRCCHAIRIHGHVIPGPSTFVNTVYWGLVSGAQGCGARGHWGTVYWGTRLWGTKLWGTTSLGQNPWGTMHWGRWSLGPKVVGHEVVGHDVTGAKSLGHNVLGHDDLGHNDGHRKAQGHETG